MSYEIDFIDSDLSSGILWKIIPGLKKNIPGAIVPIVPLMRRTEGPAYLTGVGKLRPYDLIN